jgi:hypothetical protein
VMGPLYSNGANDYQIDTRPPRLEKQTRGTWTTRHEPRELEHAEILLDS